MNNFHIDITEPHMASKQTGGLEKPTAVTMTMCTNDVSPNLFTQSVKFVSCHRSGSIANGTAVLDLQAVNYQGMSDCHSSWENDLAL